MTGCAFMHTMAINGLWNKRCGPGGGTRHLHHHDAFCWHDIKCGGEIRIDVRSKDNVFARHGTTVSDQAI